jgi:hypothetical protein
MSYLGNKVMNDGRGDRHGVIARDGDTGVDLLAYCWVIATEGTASPHVLRWLLGTLA